MLIEEIRKKLMASGHNLTDDEVMAVIEETVLYGEEELPFDEYEKIIKRIYARLRSKLGNLEL